MFEQTASLGGTQGEIVLGSVREIAVAGRGNPAIQQARHRGVVSGSGCFAAACLRRSRPRAASRLTPSASAPAGEPNRLCGRRRQTNDVTVGRTATTTYTITDTGVAGDPDGNPSEGARSQVRPPPARGTGSCRSSLRSATGTTLSSAAPGTTYILGGEGGDTLRGATATTSSTRASVRTFAGLRVPSTPSTAIPASTRSPSLPPRPPGGARQPDRHHDRRTPPATSRRHRRGSNGSWTDPGPGRNSVRRRDQSAATRPRS